MPGLSPCSSTRQRLSSNEVCGKFASVHPSAIPATLRFERAGTGGPANRRARSLRIQSRRSLCGRGVPNRYPRLAQTDPVAVPDGSERKGVG